MARGARHGRRVSASEIVFFDGGCGLCHATVRFVLRRDRAARFVFAAIHGETFRATFAETERAAIPDTVVVRTADGRTLLRSDAVVHLLRALAPPWPACAAVLSVIPRPLRDLGYRTVAKIRRALTSPPPDACPVVPPDLRPRFLP